MFILTLRFQCKKKSSTLEKADSRKVVYTIISFLSMGSGTRYIIFFNPQLKIRNSQFSYIASDKLEK